MPITPARRAVLRKQARKRARVAIKTANKAIAGRKFKTTAAKNAARKKAFQKSFRSTSKFASIRSGAAFKKTKKRK